MLSCARWLELLAAYKAGGASRAAADQTAAVKETSDALQERAKVDDVVRAADPDAARDELRRWTSDPGTH